MSPVTIVVHTYNRPDFLARLVRYYDSVPAAWRCRIVIADGSYDEQWAVFEQRMRSNPVSIPLDISRHPSDVPLYQRLHRVIVDIDSRYVVLAADDDLYFFDWITEAVAFLESRPDFGIVYGQYCEFKLDAFVPYGRTLAISYPPLENPPFAYLEDETPQARVAQIAISPLGLATTGWYALQRTELLATILDYGVRYHLEPLLFEKFMIVAQAAATKTRMLDRLIIARQQEIWNDRPPMGIRNNEQRLDALRRCCCEYLQHVVGLPASEARATTEVALGTELALMKDADRKRYLRKVARHVPALWKLWRNVRSLPAGAASRDTRLPQIPTLGAFKKQEDSIAKIVLRPETSQLRAAT